MKKQFFCSENGYSKVQHVSCYQIDFRKEKKRFFFFLTSMAAVVWRTRWYVCNELEKSSSVCWPPSDAAIDDKRAYPSQRGKDEKMIAQLELAASGGGQSLGKKKKKKDQLDGLCF